MARLGIIAGDQLNRDSSLFKQLRQSDCLFMAELLQESLHVPSHKTRSALFLAAMRHFAVELAEDGWDLHYRSIYGPILQAAEKQIHATAFKRTAADRSTKKGSLPDATGKTTFEESLLDFWKRKEEKK